ncbi:MAG: serine/threonine protein kinase, partial [Planctomycetes bacterium]|nr:serine/threonine protein kinase [Planctomycetota bacterium]
MSLGPWRLHRVLGRGGMGYVYEGTDDRGRSAAVKVLDRILAGEAHHVERFRRESEILSRLSHPNVITVHEVGEEDGVPFLVMELVLGPERRPLTFDWILAEDRLDLPARLDLFEQALAGLSHAHAKGVVHCDFKPSNVLVGRSGRSGRLHAKLIDFGIARLPREPGDPLLLSGRVAGTARYMSPEQRTRRAQLDARTDIYSAGIFLAEVLTGEAPGTNGEERAPGGRGTE